MTDARGTATSYGYNAAGDLTSVSGALTVTYARDNVGRPTSMTDSTGTTTYIWNRFNQLVTATFPGGRGVSATYDAAGNRLTLTYPGANRQVTYGYDGRNLATSVTIGGGGQTAFTYDAAGNLTGITFPSGTGVTAAATYDNANRLTGITHSGGGGAIAQALYTLDAAGNRTAKTTTAGTETYGYDALNRLTSAADTTFTYDAVGNRLTQTTAGTTTTYSYDAADELTRITANGQGMALTSDAAGNTTTKGSTAYTWDAANRLTSVAMAYRGDGLRQSRTAGGTTTSSIWNLTARIPQVLDDGANQYIYGPAGRHGRTGYWRDASPNIVGDGWPVPSRGPPSVSRGGCHVRHTRRALHHADCRCR